MSVVEATKKAVLPDESGSRSRYGTTNKIFICYLVCSSVLCVLPMLFYFLASACYKRQYRAAAAVNMECFLYFHLFLTDTLLLFKILHFVFGKYPDLLEGQLIQNRTAAALVIAAVCAAILLVISAGWRYYRIYKGMRRDKIGLVSALLKESYLEDIKYGIPTLIVYNSCGPLFTREKGRGDTIYNSEVAYDVYLYCTSLLLLVPACFAKLCEYLHYRKKDRMLSVVRMCASLMHVLLINAVLISAISYAVLCAHPVTTLGILQGSLGFAIMCGISISALLTVFATLFCCYVVKRREDVRLTDSMARTVLKFGFPTLVMQHLCKLSLAWEKSKKGGKKYPRDKFISDLLRFIVSAMMLLPVYFLHISERLKKKGKKKTAAIFHKIWEISYVFLGNCISLGGVFTGVFSLFALSGSDFLAASPWELGFSYAFFVSVVVLIIAAVYDCTTMQRQSKESGKSWEELIIDDQYTSGNMLGFGILDLIVRALVKMLSFIQCEKSNYGDGPSAQKREVVIDSSVMSCEVVQSR